MPRVSFGGILQSDEQSLHSMVDGHLNGDELRSYLTLDMSGPEMAAAYAHMRSCAHCNAQYRQMVDQFARAQSDGAEHADEDRDD